VGVPWEALLEINGTFVAEVVKQQERVKFTWVLEPESAVQFDACAFHGGLGGAGL
jgi:hypothetical protein